VAVELTPDDLAPFASIEEEKAQAMIDDALALAARVAPCILDDDFEFEDAGRAIIRGAILRWNDQGSGAVPHLQAGPYLMQPQTNQPRRSLFFPSEITELAALCDAGPTRRAYMVDLIPPDEDES
jgi:hypothetical protein